MILVFRREQGNEYFVTVFLGSESNRTGAEEASRIRSGGPDGLGKQAVNLKLHLLKRKSFHVFIIPLVPHSHGHYRLCYSELV